MNPIPEAARSGLEKFLKEDLAGAVVTAASPYVDEDGRIYFDEIALRLGDGREVVVAAEMRSKWPAIVLEINPGDGWRNMTAREDYSDELEELTAAPWHPEPPEPWDRE